MPVKDVLIRAAMQCLCALSQAKQYCLFAPRSGKSVFLETTLPLFSYGCEL